MSHTEEYNRYGFVEAKRLTLKEFADLFKNERKVSKRKIQWLKLIEAGGDKLICPETGQKVSYCCLDVRYHKGKEENGIISRHYNFYSNKDELFTVDHIIPKSKGGKKMHIDNLQAMIGERNWKKSDKI